MSDELFPLTLKPIGVVKNGVGEKPAEADWWQELVSEVVIEPGLSDALDGLEDFSHLIILWWMHRAPAGEMPLKIHPRGRQNAPLVGLFAARTPKRPNPIGKTTVRLLQRRGNVLSVKGLDALDGTPVLDIKPYLPGYDSADDAEVPPWAMHE